MKKNTVLLVAGISTLIQASLQFILCGLAVAQYLCIFDLLLELPLLLYIRILYFHNPSCSTRVNIGHAIDGMAEQAFVLVTREPAPNFRTFLTSAVYLGLAVVWLLTSLVLIQAGSKNSRSIHVRWPWLMVMVVTFVLDICSTVACITDTFQTRTARHGGAAELQGQMPWSYMPPAAHRMRDQLPPDEELPPVPVPDYTLHPTYRKASVHRAGSSVSGQFTHTSRRDLNSSPLPRYLVFPF